MCVYLTSVLFFTLTKKSMVVTFLSSSFSTPCFPLPLSSSLHILISVPSLSLWLPLSAVFVGWYEALVEFLFDVLCAPGCVLGSCLACLYSKLRSITFLKAHYALFTGTWIPESCLSKQTVGRLCTVILSVLNRLCWTYVLCKGSVNFLVSCVTSTRFSS